MRKKLLLFLRTIGLLLSGFITVGVLVPIPLFVSRNRQLQLGLQELVQSIGFSVLVAAVSLWVFVKLVRLDLGPKPNHCSYCSHDLSGNVIGVCPECGKAVDCRFERTP